MITRSLQAKILVFTVFFIGIASGVLIANFYESRVNSRPQAADTRDRSAKAQRDISKMHDYLGLNQDQREQVTKILEEARGEFQKLRAETQPKFQALQEQSRTKIRAILNEEQRQKYEEFRRKMEERRRSRDRNSDRDHDRDQDDRE